jgi:hypothetical protein
LLKCKYFDPSSLAEMHVDADPGNQATVLGDRARRSNDARWRPARQCRHPTAGPCGPRSLDRFRIPLENADSSFTNTIERYLLTWLAEAAPPNVHLILVFDRGYARVELIKDVHRGQQPFLIRAPHKVIVQTRIGGRRRRLSLGRLPIRSTNRSAIVMCSTIARR